MIMMKSIENIRLSSVLGNHLPPSKEGGRNECRKVIRSEEQEQKGSSILRGETVEKRGVGLKFTSLPVERCSSR